MIDLQPLTDRYRSLATRLEGQPHHDEVRAVFLELASQVGELEAAVNERVKGRETSLDGQEARLALDQMKASLRAVGLDIRLASPPSIAIGLETVLETTFETLARLQRIDRTSP
jgi:hypothetical protein